MRHPLTLLILICLTVNIPAAYAQKKSIGKTAVTKKTPTSEELLQQAEDYYNGTNGAFMNREKAKELFRQSADMGNTKAQIAIYELYVTTDQKASLKYLRMAAEKEDSLAMYYLGDIYAQGLHGIAVDEEQALYWYKLSANHGDPGGQMKLGLYHYTGRCGLVPDEEKAFSLFLKAAEQDYGPACFFVMNGYAYGKGVERDEEKAIFYCKKGADLGDANSQNMYGRMLEQGIGSVRKNEIQAFIHFKKAAEQGNAEAMFSVGEYYRKGTGGLQISKDKAKEWYIKASESGNTKALIMIADFLCSDNQERLSWYRKAAEKGDITGQAELAWAHCTGEIDNYDPNAGAQELQKLSKTGNPRAVYYFGELLLQGKCGIPKNKKAAKRMFESIKDNADDGKASFCAQMNLYKIK
ncbi:MAG: sel1 repeat family protein [Bacteroidales bacterium]|nr:sel1 repeat family protein [Bacteroidales bacterium]MCM1147976.1 sel1 repeat family protein [Bacteroidales bacterium]MCM1206900.1 sel1 repeat family protein [Bacillota bacterium]MCM1509533.1 sel1 repeat family protein [Clostridium sp.]